MRNIKMKTTKKCLLGLAGGLLLGTSSLASAAFLPFTIQEGAVPGTPDNLLVDVGKFTGSYQEIITINDDFSLNFFGVASWAGFDDTLGQPVDSFLRSPQPNGYRLYSIFSGSGTFNPGTNRFSIDEAAFSWTADPDGDTTFFGGNLTTYASANTALDAIASTGGITGASEDVDFGGSDTLFFGTGIGGVPGAFQAIWTDFELTAAGEAYFVAPRPFYITVEATGDVDQDNFAPGTFGITGDVSAIFVDIPEPGTLALMGLALTMLGLTGIRRRQQG